MGRERFERSTNGLKVRCSTDTFLFDDDFREAAAEVFAFISNGQCNLEGGFGVNVGDGLVVFKQG